MRLSAIVAFASCVSSMHGAAISSCDDADVDIDTVLVQAQEVTKRTLESDAARRTSGSGCTPQNLSIRREWYVVVLDNMKVIFAHAYFRGALSRTERKAYTDAVVCLQNKAAHATADFAPGAKSRFDDWVATHISQSLTIHYTGTFLAWHRWFAWLYEQALREECGYTGTQPYWNWATTAVTGLESSPIFDGSDSSMGGNGAKVQQTGNIVLNGGGLPSLSLPTGSGGGCVTSGPFKNMSVNLGPADLSIAGNITLVQANPLAYNPRCLKRDLTDAINQRYANSTSILNTIRQQTIYDFEMIMQGVPGSGDIGVHGGGHYAFGTQCLLTVHERSANMSVQVVIQAVMFSCPLENLPFTSTTV